MHQRIANYFRKTYLTSPSTQAIINSMRNPLKKSEPIPTPSPESFNYSVAYLNGGFAFSVTPKSSEFAPVKTVISNWANPQDIKEIVEHGTIDHNDNIDLGYMSGFLTEDFIIYIKSLVMESYQRETLLVPAS